MRSPVRFRVAMLVASLAFVMSTAAHAGTLRTPAVPANNGEIVDCLITNVGTKDATVSIQLINFAGIVIAPDQQDCGNGQLPPLRSCQATAPVNTPVSCVFTFKGKVRAAAYVFDGSNGLAGVVPATK